MSQYAIITDLNRCVGCMACMVACKAVNEVEVGSYWNKLLRVGPSKKADYARSNDVEMYYLPVQCNHCTNPECVTVCPTGASVKLENGTVQIDPEQCIGCQLCVSACPYGVRYLNDVTGTVQKCTLCAPIVEEGGLPQCVSQCGGRARFFGDLEAGFETFEAPDIAYDVNRDPSVVSYEALASGNRVTLGAQAKPFEASDVYTLNNDGADPNMYYILRDREWKTGVTIQTEANYVATVEL